MNVQRLILFTLGSSSLFSQAACIGTTCGNTDFKITDETYSVTKWSFEQALEESGVENPEEVPCLAVCDAAISIFGELYVSGDCSMDIDYAALEEEVDSGEATDSGAEDDEIEIGTVTCSGEGYHYCEGRRPLGFQEKDCDYFAKSAHLEACSVIAFQQLVRQLQNWNAPLEFVQRAEKAIRDEKRHAAQMRMLASRYNETIPPLEIEEVDESDILTAAIHNAMEGCIFETWAVVEAQLKAERAETTEIRRIYAGIANDEQEHAQLSWDLHSWFMSILSMEEQDQVRSAQKKAIQQLTETAVARFERIPSVLGLGTVDNRSEIVTRFVQQLAA